MLDGEIVLFDADGRPGLRRARPAHPPGGVADQRCSPSRRRRASSPSTCSRATTSRCSRCRRRERRERLAAVVDKPVDLTPATEDPDEAQPWLQHAEGVIAKRQDAPYKPGERVGMAKIKRVRTIDAVVMGWRPGKEEGTRRLADPRPLRRGGRAARRRPHLGLQGGREARAAGARSRPTRPASAAWATRAAGTTSASSSGSRCAPSSWSRSRSTTSRNDRIRHGTKIEPLARRQGPEGVPVRAA